MSKAAGNPVAAPEVSREHTRQARGARRQAVADVRRSLILAAAQAAFLESGLEGASLREIARRAGYTPGAIYSYFASKEDVYAALLGESLERLNDCVQASAGAAGGTGAQRRVTAGAKAFFNFYLDNPRDLDLGFYLFQGMKPRGLTPALNARLNARLRDALAPVREGFLELGLSPGEAQTEVTALFAHVVGLLVLSHTGRIRMFRQQSSGLFQRYLDDTLARIEAKMLPVSPARTTFRGSSPATTQGALP